MKLYNVYYHYPDPKGYVLLCPLTNKDFLRIDDTATVFLRLRSNITDMDLTDWKPIPKRKTYQEI